MTERTRPGGPRDRLVVVSNRLPVTLEERDGRPALQRGSGGLVTALAPILERQGGLWVGWPGPAEGQTLDAVVAAYNREHAFQLVTVPLSAEEVEAYYLGFSNGTLWPLFHDMLGQTRFDEAAWLAYEVVNQRFARVLADVLRPGDRVWIHDYHLMRLAVHLRALGVGLPMGFFLHIPFPSLDLFRRLPWREELLEGLLAFDLVGLQSARDWRNFLRIARSMRAGLRIRGRPREAHLDLPEGRCLTAGHFPISIDFVEFDHGARALEVGRAAEQLKQAYGSRHLILGLDRLDYTKGIPERLLAFERFLERHPEFRDQVSMIQIVVPSRVDAPAYQTLKEGLDQRVGRINGRFSRPGGVPVYYFFKHLDRAELLAHYRACEIALVTPLKDGMNLVAKEFCAASIDLNGILVLSEFAGAANQLKSGALLVNPYDIERTAEAIHQAVVMSAEERKERMKRMRAEVRRNDVHRWVGWFMSTFDAKNAALEC
jgi:trehalose 6-phosphate synthase